MPRLTNEVAIERSVEILTMRRGQYPKDPGRLYPRRTVAAFGRINGKPFHAVSTRDTGCMASFWHRVRGIGLTGREIAALKARMARLAPAEVHDRTHLPFEESGEDGLVADLFEGRVLHFVVPDRALNAAMKAEGGQWSDYDRCWNAILGADVDALAALGIRLRPAPDVRRLDGASDGMRQLLRDAGAWRVHGLDAWFVDVAVADPAALRELGVRTAESLDEALRAAADRAGGPTAPARRG